MACVLSFICLDALLKEMESVKLELKKTNESITKTNESVTKTNESITKTNESVNVLISFELDPWEGIADSQRTRESSQTLRQTVLAYYSIDSNFCMVCGDASGVVNAHIWPVHSRGKGLKYVGLDASDVNDARNVLRLCKPIEVAFDKKEVMIIAEGDQFILVVLNPDLMGKSVVGTPFIFSDCHKNPLQFCDRKCIPPVYPFRRLLAVHAHQAIRNAEKHNWPCDYSDPMVARRTVQNLLGKSLLGDSSDKVMRFLDSGNFAL